MKPESKLSKIQKSMMARQQYQPIPVIEVVRSLSSLSLCLSLWIRFQPVVEEDIDWWSKYYASKGDFNKCGTYTEKGYETLSVRKLFNQGRCPFPVRCSRSIRIRWNSSSCTKVSAISVERLNCLEERRSSKKRTKSSGSSKACSKSIPCRRIPRRVFLLGSWRIFLRVPWRNVSFVFTSFERWICSRRTRTASPIRTSRSNWAKHASTIETNEFPTRRRRSSEGQWPSPFSF